MPTIAEGTASRMWPWLLVALGAHTGWGIYPVLGRYLQTVSGLPSLSILVVGYTPLALIFLFHALPRHGRTIARSRGLWIFALIVVARSITNILAARYTLAIYVQLITLMTPFIVAFLSTLVLREELPRNTWLALILSTLGSLLMLSNDIGADGIRFALTRSDWTGIGLALASALFLALYMIAAGRTARIELSGWSVLLFQSIVIMSVTLTISLLIGEEWGRWLEIGRSDWVVMGMYTLVVVAWANGMQIGGRCAAAWRGAEFSMASCRHGRCACHIELVPVTAPWRLTGNGWVNAGSAQAACREGMFHVKHFAAHVCT